LLATHGVIDAGSETPVNDLAIIIVSYNTRSDLEGCLRSLHDPAPDLAHEIVVVDNGSTDGSPDAARACKHVRVIEAGGNVGFSRANNIGIRATSSEFVLLLNSDTLVSPGAIDRLVADLRAHPGAAVVGPRLVDAAGRAEISFGPMIGPFSELRQKALRWLYDHRSQWAERLVAGRTTAPHYPDWVSGACLLVRRADAEAAGLLDERYVMYTEDVDFCAALRARGRRVRFTPVAEIVHLRGRSGASNRRATSEAYRRSQIAFYEKHHPGWSPWLKRYLRLRGRLPRGL
jgi:hypothetical protein